eukprot:m.45878 g.45878  ORF g.45878 m.45878 type:complete len:304 (+) comp10700_c0_seq1:1151-2062(+)
MRHLTVLGISILTWQEMTFERFSQSQRRRQLALKQNVQLKHSVSMPRCAQRVFATNKNQKNKEYHVMMVWKPRTKTCAMGWVNALGLIFAKTSLAKHSLNATQWGRALMAYAPTLPKNRAWHATMEMTELPATCVMAKECVRVLTCVMGLNALRHRNVLRKALASGDNAALISNPLQHHVMTGLRPQMKMPVMEKGYAWGLIIARGLSALLCHSVTFLGHVAMVCVLRCLRLWEWNVMIVMMPPTLTLVTVRVLVLVLIYVTTSSVKHHWNAKNQVSVIVGCAPLKTSLFLCWAYSTKLLCFV